MVTLIAGLLPLTARGVSACSCFGDTPKQLARNADVVFTGIVERVTEIRKRLVTRFEIRVVYKGPLRRHMDVGSGSHEETCGVRFDEGMKYTVFAQRADDGDLGTTLCDGNKRGRIRHARYGLPRGRRF